MIHQRFLVTPNTDSLRSELHDFKRSLSREASEGLGVVVEADVARVAGQVAGGRRVVEETKAEEGFTWMKWR